MSLFCSELDFDVNDESGGGLDTFLLCLGSGVRARGLEALLLRTFALTLGGSVVTVVLDGMLFPFWASLGVKPLDKRVYARLSMPYGRHCGRIGGDCHRSSSSVFLICFVIVLTIFENLSAWSDAIQSTSGRVHWEYRR